MGERNIIEALKERRHGMHLKPGTKIKIAREIQEPLTDVELKEIDHGRISFTSESPIKEGEIVVLTLRIDDHICDMRSKVVTVNSSSDSYEVAAEFIYEAT